MFKCTAIFKGLADKFNYRILHESREYGKAT